jgi:hypothetical protein
MPTVASWVDELRAVFGAESINKALRRGEFWAREGGVEVGKRLGPGFVPVVQIASAVKMPRKAL